MKFLSLAFLAGALVSTDALSCWTCSHVPDLAACRANGKLQMCQKHEQSCQDEFRRGSYGTLVFKGCKDAATPSQGNPAVDTSVCRCWCYSDGCNSLSSCVPPIDPPAIPTTVPPPPTCDAPSAPEDGTVQCSEEGNGENVVYLEGSTCEYRCNSGFALIGENITTCSRTPEDTTRVRFEPGPPECRRCDVIEETEHLVVNCSNENNVGSICEFSCRGERVIFPPRHTETTCQKTATWTVEPPCCLKPCRTLDVGLALDSSGSVELHNWQTMIRFATSVIDLFQLGPERGRIGAFIFNSFIDTDTAIPLNRYVSDKDALIRAVEDFPYREGGTETGNALKYAYETFFREENGDRPDSPNVLLVVTDGKGTDPKVIEEYSRLLREKDVIIYAVAIYDKDTSRAVVRNILRQLNTIAGKNGEVFKVDRGFEALDESIAATVGSSFCTERACPPREVEVAPRK